VAGAFGNLASVPAASSSVPSNGPIAGENPENFNGLFAFAVSGCNECENRVGLSDDLTENRNDR